MGFLETGSWGSEETASREIYDAFRAAGGNFIDTANTYGNGAAERMLGEFMARDRDEVVVMTKYTGSYPGSNLTKDPNRAGSHRKSLRRAVEGSMQRLRTDYLDILCVHSWDFLTPLEEVMEGLDDLVRRGQVLYLGVSNVPAWIVARANTIAELRGSSPFVTYSAEYNLIERDGDREILPMARALDITVTGWTPLASGLLTGKYATGEPSNEPRRLDDPVMKRFAPQNERALGIVREVCAIAAAIGCRPAHVALNWLRRRGVIPVIGARTAAQIKDNLACFDVELSEDHVRRLEVASRIKLGYPHDFLASGIVKKFTYGEMRDVIDDHRMPVRGVSR